MAKGLLQTEKERAAGELKFAVLGETLHVHVRAEERDLPLDADLGALQGVREFDDPDLARLAY